MTDENTGGGEDFAAMLEASGGLETIKFDLGDKVQGTVVHIAKENLFVSLSGTQEASMSLEDVLDEHGDLTVAVGDTIEAFVVARRNGIELSRKLGRDQIDMGMLENARAGKIPIEGTVTGTNKGGLELTLAGTRAFCPMGQADIEYVEDPTVFVGKTFEFAVTEIEENGRNVVVSRRALLEVARKKAADELLETLAEGQRIEGKVVRLAKFGAFVDLGGLDGLIPISELSFSRVQRTEDVLSEGDQVTVDILRIEDDPKRPGRPRIALSLKAALPDPFESHRTQLHEGATLDGVVTRVEAYGAFVQVFDGVEGLVHISEMRAERVRHPSDVVTPGATVRVRVLGLDMEQRRVSLSLKEAPQEDGSDVGELAEGALAIGKVERIERYGVFVLLDRGGKALLPAAETGTPRGTDLQRVFPVGTEIPVKVIAIDEQGRIKVSKTAREQADERAVVRDYNKGQSGSGKGFGTLGDLLKSKQKG